MEPTDPSVVPEAPGDKRAVSAAEEAVKFNDKEYAYARSLGAALYRAARHEDAVKELARALTLRKQPSPAVPGTRLAAGWAPS